jgi:hypothetical protein
MDSIMFKHLFKLKFFEIHSLFVLRTYWKIYKLRIAERKFGKLF